MQNIQWNSLMYQHLGLILLKDMLGDCSIHHDEQKLYDINQEIINLELELTSHEILVSTSEAIKIRNEYEETIHEEYCGCDCSDEVFDFKPIEFDTQLYEIWKQAVRLKKVVKLTYNSLSSGMSTRLVDPYKSSAPYGEGYCHTRKEVRKFRFDRVLDLELTDEKFVKKKQATL